MYIRKFFYSLGKVIFFTLAISTSVSALTQTQIDHVKVSGLTYLMKTINEQGYWDRGLDGLLPNGSTSESIRATAETLNVLTRLGLRGPVYYHSLNWLANANATNVDSMARKLIALENANVVHGGSLSALTEEVHTIRSNEGNARELGAYMLSLLTTPDDAGAPPENALLNNGPIQMQWFGYNKHFSVNYIDSALAAYALKLNGTTEAIQLSNSIAQFMNEKGKVPWSYTAFTELDLPDNKFYHGILELVYHGYGLVYLNNTVNATAVSILNELVQLQASSGNIDLTGNITITDTAVYVSTLERALELGYGAQVTGLATSLENAKDYLYDMYFSENIGGDLSSDNNFQTYPKPFTVALAMNALTYGEGPLTDTDSDGVPDAVELNLDRDPNTAEYDYAWYNFDAYAELLLQASAVDAQIQVGDFYEIELHAGWFGAVDLTDGVLPPGITLEIDTLEPSNMQSYKLRGTATTVGNYSSYYLGFFLLSLNGPNIKAGTININVVDASSDSDGDGMTRAFELANGLDPLDAADGLLDMDGDGWSNSAEFLAGTGINDGSSTPNFSGQDCLSIDEVVSGNNRPKISAVHSREVSWDQGASIDVTACDYEEGDLSLSINWKHGFWSLDPKDLSNDSLAQLYEETNILGSGTGTSATVGLVSIEDRETANGVESVLARVSDQAGGIDYHAINIIRPNLPPEVVVSSSESVVAVTEELIVNASSVDTEDGNLSGSIRWEIDGNPLAHQGDSILFTPNTEGTELTASASGATIAYADTSSGGAGSSSIEESGLNPGNHIISAVSEDSSGATTKVNLNVFVNSTSVNNPVEIIIDDADQDAQFIGQWFSSLAEQEWGQDSKYAQALDSQNTARFTTTVPESGLYDVSVWNACHGNRNTQVLHEVSHANGETGVVVDQQKDSGTCGDWHSLGEFEFQFGADAHVEISDAGLIGQGYIGADAIRFYKSGFVSANNAPSLQVRSPSNGNTYSVGSSVVLNASGYDIEEGDLDGLVEWSSSLDGDLGRGAYLVVDSLSIGTHEITTRVSDKQGESAEQKLEIEVVEQLDQAPIIQLEAPKDYYYYRDVIVIEAAAEDDIDGDVSESIEWYSKDDELLYSDERLLISLGPGEHVLKVRASDSSNNIAETAFVITVLLNEPVAIRESIRIDDSDSIVEVFSDEWGSGPEQGNGGNSTYLNVRGNQIDEYVRYRPQVNFDGTYEIKVSTFCGDFEYLVDVTISTVDGITDLGTVPCSGSNFVGLHFLTADYDNYVEIKPATPPQDAPNGWYSFYADLVTLELLHRPIKQHGNIDSQTEAGDRFGERLATGDFNGDGFEDIVAGIPEDSHLTGDLELLSAVGGVSVMYGGGLLSFGYKIQFLSRYDAAVPGKPIAGERFGESVAAGDFNGDGFSDLAIGISHADFSGFTDAGEVMVLYGTENGLDTTNVSTYRQGIDGLAGTAESNDLFGKVLVADDFDGDGFYDLAVGAPGEGVKPNWYTSSRPNAGVVHLIYGSSGGLTTSNDVSWTQQSSAIAGTAETGDEFGGSLFSGDFNGDGNADLVIGVPGEGLGSTSNAGLITVLFGSPSGVSGSGRINKTVESSGTHVPGVNDQFGLMATAIDINGDGRDELVVSAPGRDVEGNDSAGVVYFYTYDVANSELDETLVFDRVSMSGVGSSQTNERFGHSLQSIDYNGDGYLDLAVGAPGKSIDALVAVGEVYLIPGNGVSLDPTSSQGIHPNYRETRFQLENDYYGYSIVSADVNNDSYPELFVGVPGWDANKLEDSGAISLHFGRANGLEWFFETRHYAARMESLSKWPVDIVESFGRGNTVTGAGLYNEGDTAIVEATPASGFVFEGWTGTVESASTVLNLTMDKAYKLIPKFTQIETIMYDVAAVVLPTEGGSVAGTGTFESGTEITISATAATGYEFVGWTGAMVSTDSTLTFTLTQDIEVIANFQRLEYSLTVSSSSFEAGTVSGSGVFKYGEPVIVGADASAGYGFIDWVGDLNSTTNPFEFLITSDLNLTANFEPVEITFDINVSTIGPGSVSGGGNHVQGSTVEMIATGAPGYAFSYWGGDFNGSQNPVNLFVNADLNVVAYFSTDNDPDALSEADDRYGTVLASGDFNADGLEDLVVGAPMEDLFVSGAQVDSAGALSINYGALVSPTFASTVFLNRSTTGIPGDPSEGDQFAKALAAGDFNGDGYSDLAIGIPGSDFSGITDAGEVNVIYGGASGLDMQTVTTFKQGASSIQGTAETGDFFGDILTVGDFNNDGFADLAIGAPRENVKPNWYTATRVDSGVVHVIYGSSLGLTGTGDAAWTQKSVGGGNAEATDEFGGALAVGDVNGDGTDDLVVGSPGEDVGSISDGGYVTVMFGGASGITAASSISRHIASSGTESVFAHDRFGEQIKLHDLDNDGSAEIIAAAPGRDVNGVIDTGRVYILSVESGSYVVDQSLDLPSISGISGQVGDAFGSSLEFADYNADGIVDLLVGASGRSVYGETQSGDVLILAGDGNGVDSSSAISIATDYLDQQSVGSYDEIGRSIEVLDFSGDGLFELVIGAPGWDYGAEGSALDAAGLVFILQEDAGGLSNNTYFERPQGFR